MVEVERAQKSGAVQKHKWFLAYMGAGKNAQKCMMAAMFYEGWYVSSPNVEILANYAPAETI